MEKQKPAIILIDGDEIRKNVQEIFEKDVLPTWENWRKSQLSIPPNFKPLD